MAVLLLVIAAPTGSSLELSSILVTDALLVVPLIASGIAWVRFDLCCAVERKIPSRPYDRAR